MTAPQRIQLRRTKGWRKPEGAIVVARPSIYGNPWIVEPDGPRAWKVRDFAGPGDHYSVLQERTARGIARRRYRDALLAGELDITPGYVRDMLAGKDLACWCPLDEPCHADVLLEIANAGVDL